MFRGILTGIAFTLFVQFVVMTYALLSQDEKRPK